MKDQRHKLIELIYKQRKNKITHPVGYFDHKSIWNPDKNKEYIEICCSTTTRGSKRFPYSFLSHCRTKKHISNLVNSMPDEQIIELLDYNITNEYLNCCYCPFCGSWKAKTYHANPKKNYPNRIFCPDCNNIIPLNSINEINKPQPTILDKKRKLPQQKITNYV